MLGLSKRKILETSFGVVMVLALTLSAIPHFGPTAHAQTPPATPTTTTTTTPPATPGTTNPSTNCAVEKIGWFVCPVMEQVAKISDKAFQVLADNFLSVDPELVSNQSGTKDAWEIARNIANIMFIVAFLAVIVSQVTGMGINNYGLKKMIPRLLVAAVLVNVSYYICQLIVDLTNILGYQIEEALVQISNNIGPSVFGQATQLGAANVQTGGGNFGSVIVVGALAAAGVVWLIMGPMMAVLALVLVTAITIVIILLLRKALIVLLIVGSPIAFVFYLLPNTEKLFDKWKDMFIKILLVFPVIGLLFGAGQLASTIILVSGAQSQTQAETAKNCNPDDLVDKKAFDQRTGAYAGANAGHGSYDSCGLGSVVITGTKSGDVGPSCNAGKGAGCKLATSWLLGLTAFGVAVAPLIAVWSVLKGALAASSAINGRVQSIAKKGDGAVAKAKLIDENRQKTLNARGLEGKFGGNPTAGFKQRRKMKSAARDARLSAAEEMYGASDPGARKLGEATRTSQLLGQAAKQKEAEEFMQTLAKNPNAVGAMMAGGGDHAAGLQAQLQGQQTKALAEAVKEAELHIDNADLGKLGTDLEKAVAGGDTVLARAIQNTMLKSGSAGLSEFKKTVSSIESKNGNTSDLQANVRANHGGIKDADKSIDAWGKQFGGPNKLQAYNGGGSQAAKTWGSTTAAEFAGLSKQAQAEAVNHISNQVKTDLKQDGNAQLLAKVDINLRGKL